MIFGFATASPRPMLTTIFSGAAPASGSCSRTASSAPGRRPSVLVAKRGGRRCRTAVEAASAPAPSLLALRLLAAFASRLSLARRALLLPRVGITAPLLATRTFLPLSSILTDARAACPSSGRPASRSRRGSAPRPRGCRPAAAGVGLHVTLHQVHALDDDAVARRGARASTLPRLPLSLPLMTTTIVAHLKPLHHSTSGASEMIFMNFLRAELARDRPEDAGADRLELRVDEDGAVVVELDVAAVGAAVLALGANDDRLARCRPSSPCVPGSASLIATTMTSPRPA